jgi:hypothetical protein
MEQGNWRRSLALRRFSLFKKAKNTNKRIWNKDDVLPIEEQRPSNSEISDDAP